MAFKPKPNPKVPHHVLIRCDDDLYNDIKAMAAKYQTNYGDFCRQAVRYALDHMEDES